MSGDPLGIDMTRDEVHGKLSPFDIVRRDFGAHAAEMGGCFPAVCHHPQEWKTCLPGRETEIHDLFFQLGVAGQQQSGHRDFIQGRHGNSQNHINPVAGSNKDGSGSKSVGGVGNRAGNE